MLTSELDTIAAIATPVGEGGISVIRVSGREAIQTAASLFQGKNDLAYAASHTAHVGWLQSRIGERIDEVVCLVFRAPSSYTGEDVVEISCHGGLLITRRILESLLAAGIRQAEPGEFTKRAFLNGKMDLVQAEAVADLIRAKSDSARIGSLHQLQGRLSEEIINIRSKILDSVGLLELELDFAEDGYEFVDKDKVSELLGAAEAKLESLSKGYYQSRAIREGVKVVLVGAPNVGKSSLLNALLMEDRAIVTEIPGTTRDVIEESLLLDGSIFRIADTAGLRATSDSIEEEGIRRTNEQIETADIIIFLLDLARAVSEGEKERLHQIRTKVANSEKRIILVANKVDLDSNPKNLNGFAETALKLSAKTGEGITHLKRQMVDKALEGYDSTQSSAVVSNMRQAQAIEKTKKSLGLALDSLRQRKSGEFIAVDLRAALQSLGEIIGEVTTDEILESIFAKFCIGK